MSKVWQINHDLKDWQIARIMFTKNTSRQCKIVSELKKHGELEYLCEGWYFIKNKTVNDDGGYLIPIECLKLK